MDPDPQPRITRAKEIRIHMGGEGPHQTLRKQAGFQAQDRLRQPLRYVRSYLTNTQDSAFIVRWRSRSGTRDELRALTLRVRHAR